MPDPAAANVRQLNQTNMKATWLPVRICLAISRGISSRWQQTYAFEYYAAVLKRNGILPRHKSGILLDTTVDARRSRAAFIAGANCRSPCLRCQSATLRPGYYGTCAAPDNAAYPYPRRQFPLFLPALSTALPSPPRLYYLFNKVIFLPIRVCRRPAKYKRDIAHPGNKREITDVISLLPALGLALSLAFWLSGRWPSPLFHLLYSMEASKRSPAQRSTVPIRDYKIVPVWRAWNLRV
ncbi:hypothetical protein KCP73_14070 [Salmonella enterica subsp. enterica]|nr:hypothetical protein KCP73_14070 [Salmonella enterica subsp. enterica]